MKKTLAFVDVETTGLNACLHEIIEISIVRVYPDGREDIYTTKIRPERIEYAEPTALEINGYNEEEWHAAPSADLVMPRIAEMLTDCVLIAHNVRFDEEFIAESLHRNGLRARYDRRIIDTITLAHEHLYHLPFLSLDSIRRYFGWSLSGGHRAEKDALDCMRLYRKLCRASVISRLSWRAAYHLRPIFRRAVAITRKFFF